MPPTRFSESPFVTLLAIGRPPTFPGTLGKEETEVSTPRHEDLGFFLSHREQEETRVFISHFIMAVRDAETGTIRCA